jgi:4-amino-4-deoxy-L-arabinose transferase-like glycosyltransferase
LAFVVAAALWLVPMLVAALSNADSSYRAYLDDILFHQTAGRYAKSWDHPQPWWYQLSVMLTWMPAILALPWALPAWRRRLQRRDARYLLPIAWWLLIVVFFSIPSGKRDVYIMPALPMACLALAPLLPGIVRKRWPRRLALAVALVLALAALAGGASMLFGNPGFEQRFSAERGFDAGAGPIAALLMAIGAWGVGSALWFRRRPIAVLLSTLAGTWVLFGLVGYPLLNDSSSARGLMQDVGQRIGPDAQLGLVAWKEQNLLMADRPATTFGFVVPWKQQLQHGIAWQREAPGSRWLLVQEAALSQCIVRDRAVFAGRANRRLWWLVPAGAVIPGCMPQGQALEGGTDVN